MDKVPYSLNSALNFAAMEGDCKPQKYQDFCRKESNKLMLKEIKRYLVMLHLILLMIFGSIAFSFVYGGFKRRHGEVLSSSLQYANDSTLLAVVSSTESR